MRYYVGMKKDQKLPFNAPLTLLGGITPEAFLNEYWHKKPLLVRGAIPAFTGLLSPNELAGLACEEDVQSRLVSFSKKQWHCEQGPFEEERFAKLPKRDWTLLVQSVNHHMQEATALLQQFNFIPHARLDDLMVSYAPDGGGVGPHFDSYDVFLLQGLGERLWRISEQVDLSLVEGAPLRILKHFDTQQEWTLSAGDMLYLPPHLAHWGIAVGDCMTYSIGFRAPSAEELAGEFLNYLQENREFKGRYADSDLKLQAHPAEISSEMVSHVAAMISSLKWNEGDVADFLGQYLSEPKLDVVFDPPAPISEPTFTRQLLSQGIQLDLKSQLLVSNAQFYLNGEPVVLPQSDHPILLRLADHRCLSAADLDKASAECIGFMYERFLAGYLMF
jgi:50S ribosomal protein L16 3-hydroxylase